MHRCIAPNACTRPLAGVEPQPDGCSRSAKAGHSITGTKFIQGQIEDDDTLHNLGFISDSCVMLATPVPPPPRAVNVHSAHVIANVVLRANSLLLLTFQCLLNSPKTFFCTSPVFVHPRAHNAGLIPNTHSHPALPTVGSTPFPFLPLILRLALNFHEAASRLRRSISKQPGSFFEWRAANQRLCDFWIVPLSAFSPRILRAYARWNTISFEGALDECVPPCRLVALSFAARVQCEETPCCLWGERMVCYNGCTL
jgi:hypothetical protein